VFQTVDLQKSVVSMEERNAEDSTEAALSV
jgi:hypothetical protein